LPKADQDAIEQAAAEIQPLTPELLAKTDNAALAKAKVAGAEVIIITDKAPSQRLMAPIWDQNSTKIPVARTWSLHDQRALKAKRLDRRSALSLVIRHGAASVSYLHLYRTGKRR